jgi:hypothetical protein
MNERTILADCCEDWILQFGRHYQPGEGFCCLECGASWRKGAPGHFQRVSDGRGFVERTRNCEGAEFRYLSSEDGTEPLIERCCAQILLRFGEIMTPVEFACPVCHTKWKRERGERGGLRVRCYRKGGVDEPFAIQTGSRRPFLVPLSRYRFPSD